MTIGIDLEEAAAAEVLDSEPEEAYAIYELDREEAMMEEGINPKDRIGVTKVPLHLVPPASKIHQALAMADGAAKYGPYNWRDNPVKVSIYVAAAMRHIEKFWDGQNFDEESGVHELGHAIACLGIILDAIETRCGVDDRPASGSAAELLQRFVKKEGDRL